MEVLLFAIITGVTFLHFGVLAVLHDQFMMARGRAKKLEFSQLLRSVRGLGFPFAFGKFLGSFANEIIRGGFFEAAKRGIHENVTAPSVLVENTDRQLIHQQIGK